MRVRNLWRENMQKQYILFDLDGTLTDSMLGITKSVQIALQYFGIEEKDRNKLRPFIGPPLTDSFMEFYGMSEEQALIALEKYREYFSVKGLYENKLYDGIEPLLRHLKEAGKTLFVATSKPLLYARQILEYFKIADYFDEIVGPEMDGTRNKKIEVMEYVLDKWNLTDRSQAIMVGDRKFDVEPSKELGLEVIGVLYGFGSREELLTAGADYLASSVEEVEELLLNETL